jgi:hypothetical protein
MWERIEFSSTCPCCGSTVTAEIEGKYSIVTTWAVPKEVVVQKCADGLARSYASGARPLTEAEWQEIFDGLRRETG